MALDNAKNFAKVTVSTGYDNDDTSIVLTTGHGAKLPTVPFNVVWWNSTDYADPADDPNVEIVRVTGRSSDTLTVTRAQESTSASNKNTAGKTYKMIAGLTAKVINTDLGGGGMELLASVSLGSAAASLSTGTFTPKKHLQVRYFITNVSGNVNPLLRFNGDTGSNYGYDTSTDGGSQGHQPGKLRC